MIKKFQFIRSTPVSNQGDSSDGGLAQNVKLFLAVIMTLALLLRIYISFFTSLPHMHRDSIDYFLQADAILNGEYINYFPNGYPFIIAFCKLIGGAQVHNLLLLLNIFLSSLTVYFVFRIAHRIFENTAVAILAAFIVAVLPTQLNYVRWLTSEVPSEFLLVTGYYFYSVRRYLFSGILFGLAIAVRTEFIPILLLIILTQLVWKKSFSLRFFAGSLISLLIVGSYCYMKTGQWSIAGHGKVNVMYSVTASGDYVDWYFNDKHPEITTTGQAIDMYMDTMRAYPARFLKDRVTNLYNLWSFYPGSSDASRGQLSRVIIGAGNLFMVIFGILGWWFNRRKFNPFLLIFPFIVVTGVHVFFLAISRYTYPVEPFMIILGSWMLLYLLRQTGMVKHPG